MARKTMCEYTCDLCEMKMTRPVSDEMIGWQAITIMVGRGVTARKETRDICPVCWEMLAGLVREYAKPDVK